MLAAALLVTSAALLRRERPSFLQKDEAAFGLDPHCREGIADTTLTYCCAKDCGECGDGSPVCVAKEKNGRGSTCCPADMTEQPGCDVSMAPCTIEAYVRAATANVDDITTADGTLNAADDCNKALPDEAARHLVATHFVHFPQKKPKEATTKDCSTKALELAAAKCDQDNSCVGMTTDADGNYACLLVAGTEVTELEDDTTGTYLKSKGSAGQTFHFKGKPYEPDDDCQAFCTPTQDHHVATLSAEELDSAADYKMTREIKCMSSQGTTMDLGMCSLQVALNADAYPTTEIECNCAKALPWMITHAGEEIDAVEACSETLNTNITGALHNDGKDWCTFDSIFEPAYANFKATVLVGADCVLTFKMTDPDMVTPFSFTGITDFEMMGNAVDDDQQTETIDGETFFSAYMYFETEDAPWAQGQAYGFDFDYETLEFYNADGALVPTAMMSVLGTDFVHCDERENILAMMSMRKKK